MLQVRLIASLAVVAACTFRNAAADENVVVDLISGQRLHAQSIEPDSRSPGRVLLTIGNDRIQIRRSLAWNRVRRLAAPAAQLARLQVPPQIMAVDSASMPRRRELALASPADGVGDTLSRLQSPVPPPPPLPDPDSVPPLPNDPPIAPPIAPAAAPPPDPWNTTVRVPSAGEPRIDDAGVPGEFWPPGGIPFADAGGACLAWRRDPGVVVGVRNANGPELWPPIGSPLAVVGPCFGCWRDPGVVVGVRDENPLACPVNSAEARELIVSARPFNRNGLADWISLEVQVQGRTASGLPCPVRGTLQCSLWVQNARLVRGFGESYFEEPREITLLGHWSKFLDGSEVDAAGVQRVVLDLPLQSPDHNLRLGSHGLLTAQLDIPGQGRLAASTGPVPLRQFGPIRGRSVIDYGSTLLPGESVGQGLNAAGDWPAPLSGLRPDRRRFTVQP